ncbi:MAG: CHASE4 domain-containing protein, partial [Methanomassiliicoccales archaeon]
MRIGSKTVVILGSSVLILIIILSIFSSIIISNGFEKTMRETAEEEAQQVVRLLNNDISVLDRSTTDYAAWDETYDFVLGQDPIYPDIVTTGISFGPESIDAYIVTDLNGTILLGIQYDSMNQTFVNITEGMGALFSVGGMVDGVSLDQYGISGIIRADDRIYEIATEQVLRSNGSGPSPGYVSLLRQVNQDTMDRFDLLMSAEITWYQYSGTPPGEFGSPSWAEIFSKGTVSNGALTDTSISGLALVKDIAGTGALVLRTELTLGPIERGRESVFILVSTMIFIGAIFLMLTVFFLRWSVTSKLSRLDRNVT